MYRGTTPTLTFELPFESSDLTIVNIVFCQNGSILIEKTLEDCTVSGDTLSVTLTEAETLSLNSNYRVEIQMRCACGDTRLCSDIVRIPVGSILKDGELT